MGNECYAKVKRTQIKYFYMERFQYFNLIEYIEIDKNTSTFLHFSPKNTAVVFSLVVKMAANHRG